MQTNSDNMDMRHVDMMHFVVPNPALSWRELPIDAIEVLANQSISHLIGLSQSELDSDEQSALSAVMSEIEQIRFLCRTYARKNNH